MSPLIVGLSGTTNSGKTTLSDKLKDVMPNITILNMDDYYFLEDDERHTLLPEFNNYANWEIETAVDFARLTKDVTSWKQNVEADTDEHVLIIEGIIIFKHSELAELFDLKYFITLPKDVCWERRRLRDYLPPEPSGYFHTICWPEYLHHKAELQEQEDIVYVDGNISRKDLFSVIHKGIVSAFSKTL